MFYDNKVTLICCNLEGVGCMAEDDLGIQLEDWENISEEKQDPPAISTMEESLLFESKNTI